MTPDLLLALAGYAFASSITPGPNNTMLLASGMNFGFGRTLPHMVGVSAGCAVMIAALGWGLGQLFQTHPALHLAIRWAGVAYLVYLAVKIATARQVGAAKPGGKPMTFLQAAAFQWANPKAWGMALTAITAYAAQGGVALVALVFTLVNMPCIAVWAGGGQAMRRFLDRPAVLRGFNLVMAALLLLSLYPMLRER